MGIDIDVMYLGILPKDIDFWPIDGSATFKRSQQPKNDNIKNVFIDFWR